MERLPVADLAVSALDGSQLQVWRRRQQQLIRHQLLFQLSQIHPPLPGFKARRLTG
jgi:hypothetical protein